MQRTMYIDTGTLQIFNGTLTKITCSSAGSPFFRLVREEREYGPYSQLPRLLDIQAISSGDVVSLLISGTNRSNDVTVTCRYINASSGENIILFTLMLEFISKFLNQA